MQSSRMAPLHNNLTHWWSRVGSKGMHNCLPCGPQDQLTTTLLLFIFPSFVLIFVSFLFTHFEGVKGLWALFQGDVTSEPMAY